MKHFNVKPNTYIDSSKEINDKNSKFKISDNVTILKYKNAFAKKRTLQIGCFCDLKKLKILWRVIYY